MLFIVLVVFLFSDVCVFVVVLCVFVGSVYIAADWDIRVSQFPLAVSVPGALLALLAIYIDGRALNRARINASDWLSVLKEASQQAVLPKSMKFISAIIGMILVTLFVGQKIAVPLFIFLYLMLWAKRSVSVSFLYTSLAWFFLVLFYDRIIHMQFHQPYLAFIIFGYPRHVVDSFTKWQSRLFPPPAGGEHPRGSAILADLQPRQGCPCIVW